MHDMQLDIGYAKSRRGDLVREAREARITREALLAARKERRAEGVGAKFGIFIQELRLDAGRVFGLLTSSKSKPETRRRPG